MDKTMGMFDGIDSVSSSQGGAYLLPGKHVFRVKALKQPPNLRAGDCFIAEMEVVESTSEQYITGQSVSWIRNVSKHREMALADIKGFLAAVAGCEENEIDAAGANAAVGESQPFAGHLVNCEAWNKATKDGGEFTRTLWSAHG